MKSFVKYVCIVLALSVISGCRAFRIGIYEQDPEKARPITERYDPRDFKSMPTELVQSILAHPFPPTGAEAPLLVDMGIQNRTKQHLDTIALADNITTKLLDSKKVRFVNSRQRDALLKEQGYQLKNCPESKRVKIGQQLGAKYMITGSLVELGAKSGRQVRVSRKEDVYYQLTVEVTDLETAEVVVKKQVDRMRRASKPIIGW